MALGGLLISLLSFPVDNAHAAFSYRNHAAQQRTITASEGQVTNIVNESRKTEQEKAISGDKPGHEARVKKHKKRSLSQMFIHVGAIVILISVIVIFLSFGAAVVSGLIGFVFGVVFGLAGVLVGVALIIIGIVLHLLGKRKK